MSNLIELFITRGDRIVIDSGIVSETVIHSERGVERIVHSPGTRRYFVDVVEGGGGTIGMWDGSFYVEALAAARACSVDWGNAPVIDRVRGGGA